MKFLYILSLALLMNSSAAHAERAFEGIISIERGKRFFRETDTWRLYSIRAANAYVQKDLFRLESGDALQGDGTLDTNTGVLTLTSVHFVGLQKMLGVWSSDKKTLFEFIDFNHLTVYHQDDHSPQNRYFPVKSYQYTVAPYEKGKWSILINDNTTINTGNLNVSERFLTIQLMDAQTGSVSKTLTLQRVN